MADCTTILHVSDFHLGVSEGLTCLAATEREIYLEKLYEAADKMTFDQVDLIVATGDFVDTWSTNRFDDAYDVLMELARLFKTDIKHVIPCCGNHDYERAEQTKGRFETARYHYHRFAEKLAVSTYEPPDTVCQQYEFEELPIIVFSLDSTWGNAACLPGRISEDSQEHAKGIHAISKAIANARRRAPVFILSHHPLLDIPESLKQGLEHREQHIASGYYDLVKKMETSKGLHPAFCFYGDVHLPIRWDGPSGVFHFASARLDSPRQRERNWSVQHGVRLLRLMNDGSKVETLRLDFDDPATGKTLAAFGNWHSKDPERLNKNGGWRTGIRLTRKCKWTRRPTRGKKPPNSNGSKQRTNTEIDFQELADLLRQVIFEQGLIQDCRLPSRKGYVRLANILLGPLMNNGHVMSKVFFILSRLIREKTSQHDSANDVVLVGVDSWGSWMASEIGFRTGTKSFGMTVRGLSMAHVCEEVMRRGLLARIGAQDIKEFVIVTDVIVTSDTVFRVKDSLTRVLELPPDHRFSVLSLIEAKAGPGTDASRRDEFTSRIACLAEFPIPVLGEDDVPHSR